MAEGADTQAAFLNQTDPQVSHEELIEFAPTLTELRQIARRVAKLKDGSVDYDATYGIPTLISYCYANCSAFNSYSVTDYEPR